VAALAGAVEAHGLAQQTGAHQDLLHHRPQ
jgi:hypothetical protein